MIRKAGISENAREYALKIEGTFELASETKGEPYRSIAYERMRSLKTKLSELLAKSSSLEVRDFLEQIIQGY